MAITFAGGSLRFPLDLVFVAEPLTLGIRSPQCFPSRASARMVGFAAMPANFPALD